MVLRRTIDPESGKEKLVHVDCWLSPAIESLSFLRNCLQMVLLVINGFQVSRA